MDPHEHPRKASSCACAGWQPCSSRAAWQLVPLSRDGADPLVQLETSGSGGPALCMAAASLSDRDQTPLVALRCEGFQDAVQILELG